MMKTRLDRLPIGLIELADKQAKANDMPRTAVYKNMELAMRAIDTFTDKKKNEKPLFRF